MEQTTGIPGAAPAAAPEMVQAAAVSTPGETSQQQLQAQPGETQQGQAPELQQQVPQQPQAPAFDPAAFARELAKVLPQQQALPPAQPHVSERDQFIQDTTAHYTELYGDPAAARKQAEHEWGIQERANQRAMKAAQKQILQLQHSEFQNIKAADPRFDPGRQDAFGYMVRGIAAANPNATPSQHYQIFQQQVGALQPQAQQPQIPQQYQQIPPAYGAPQIPSRAQVFATPGNGAGVSRATVTDPALEQSIAEGKARGWMTPQMEQRIRERAGQTAAAGRN